MSTMLKEIYDALKEAGASEEKASLQEAQTQVQRLRDEVASDPGG